MVSNMKKLSLYIHIPFCIQKCLYCDFLSFPAGEEKREAYLQALLQEIRTEAENYADYRADTVFLGGGTPSLLSGEQLKELMETLRKEFAFTKSPEITMEVNPGTITEEKLSAYYAAGINRLSIGTQSVHDKELKNLGRIHRAEDFYKTFETARKTGFTNLNVDVMAALPGQSAADYSDTLRAVADLKPEHISAYSLIIEEGTPFFEMYGEAANRKPAVPLPSEEEERAMYEETERFLQTRGFHRYEISNYAKDGKECRHNMAYWKRYDYAGFGLGAASMVDNVRWKNIADLEEYSERIRKRQETETSDRQTAAELPGVKEEMQPLTIQEQMEEFMFLGLRLNEGVKRADFHRYFGKKIEEVYGDVIGKLCGQGLLEEGEFIRLTPYGRDISNYVMAEFINLP